MLPSDAVFWARPSTALLNSQQLGLPAEDWAHKHSDLKEGKTHKAPLTPEDIQAVNGFH